MLEQSKFAGFFTLVTIYAFGFVVKAATEQYVETGRPFGIHTDLFCCYYCRFPFANRFRALWLDADVHLSQVLTRKLNTLFPLVLGLILYSWSAFALQLVV